MRLQRRRPGFLMKSSVTTLEEAYKRFKKKHKLSSANTLDLISVDTLYYFVENDYVNYDLYEDDNEASLASSLETFAYKNLSNTMRKKLEYEVAKYDIDEEDKFHYFLDDFLREWASGFGYDTLIDQYIIFNMFMDKYGPHYKISKEQEDELVNYYSVTKWANNDESFKDYIEYIISLD